MSCEVTGHHLYLTNLLYRQHLFKEDLVMAPPLQSPDNVSALRSCLNSHKIDFSCSDHCPFSRSQRQGAFGPFEICPTQRDFRQMPGGTNGIQVRFIATYSSTGAA